LRTASVVLVGVILAGLSLLAIGAIARLSWWVVGGGKHVSINWTSDGLSPLSPVEQAKADNQAIRDRSRLQHQKDCTCALVFFKITANPGLDARIVDLFAGFNGATHVSLDCCVSDVSGPWMIDSDQGIADGPEYKGFRAWQGRWRARVPISDLIDCERLYQDLAERIADPRVRQKGLAYWTDFALGRTDPNVVTCSGLIGQCILRQPSSRLAAALRQAIQERITYGELTPNDLARAVAIEEAAQPGAQFIQTPWLNAVWNAVRY